MFLFLSILRTILLGTHTGPALTVLRCMFQEKGIKKARKSDGRQSNARIRQRIDPILPRLSHASLQVQEAKLRRIRKDCIRNWTRSHTRTLIYCLCTLLFTPTCLMCYCLIDYILICFFIYFHKYLTHSIAYFH